MLAVGSKEMRERDRLSRMWLWSSCLSLFVMVTREGKDGNGEAIVPVSVAADPVDMPFFLA
jgi:hypothetical protein